MNSEKLKNIQDQVRIGGKGTSRRKKKVVHSTLSGGDPKKLEKALKKCEAHPIDDVEELFLIREDGSLIKMHKPEMQGSFRNGFFAFRERPHEGHVQQDVQQKGDDSASK